MSSLLKIDSTMTSIPREPYRPLIWMRDACWRTAEEKGWHTLQKSVGEDIALMHSELSEALEEYRAGRKPHEIYVEDDVTLDEDGLPPADASLDGIPIELADVLIRIFDFCGEHGIDIAMALALKMRYNRTRPMLHGGKKL